MPGARSLWMVAIKLMPVKMDENPSTKAVIVIKVTVPSVVVE